MTLEEHFVRKLPREYNNQAGLDDANTSWQFLFLNVPGLLSKINNGIVIDFGGGSGTSTQAEGETASSRIYEPWFLRVAWLLGAIPVNFDLHEEHQLDKGRIHHFKENFLPILTQVGISRKIASLHLNNSPVIIINTEKTLDNLGLTMLKNSNNAQILAAKMGLLAQAENILIPGGVLALERNIYQKQAKGLRKIN